jgi:hypothetical protein
MLSTGQGVMGHNAYAYCLDNPVRYKDSQGSEAEENENYNSNLDEFLAIYRNTYGHDFYQDHPGIKKKSLKVKKEQYIETKTDRTLEAFLSPANCIGNIITTFSIFFFGPASALGYIPNLFIIDDGPDVTRTHYIVTFITEEKEYTYFSDGYIVDEYKYDNTETYRIGAGSGSRFD